MSTEPRWKSVLFDLDGTLCNTIALIVASYQHALGEVLSHEEDPEVIRGWIGRTLPDVFSQWPEQAQALDRSYVTFNLANLARLQTSYDGIPVLLADLAEAGVRIGVVTSKRRPTAVLSLQAAGIDGLVEVACGLEDTKAHKPDPEPLQVGMRKLGMDPADTVYIGDATVDVRAAKAAGIDQVSVTWGSGTPDELRAEQPTALVTTVGELRALLLG